MNGFILKIWTDSDLNDRAYQLRLIVADKAFKKPL